MIKNLLHINKKNSELTVSQKIDNLFDLLDEYIIVIDIGEDLSPHNKLIVDIIQELREEIKSECGFIFPEIYIRENSGLQENEFVVYIRNNMAAKGFLIPNQSGITDEFYDVFKTALYNNVDKIFSNELVERYIDTAQRKNGWLIWNIVKILSVPEIKIILSDIISSGKSINNIGYIFEKIGEEVLLDGGYQDNFKTQNPHNIAKKVVKFL